MYYLLSSEGVRSKAVRSRLVGEEIYTRRFSGKTESGLVLCLEFHLDIGLMDRIYEFSRRVRTATAEQTGPIHFLQNMN
jgi:hypothetical protein